MSTFLTDEELVELTGAKRKSNQIRWLTQHRYPHETNANGAPKVLRCYLGYPQRVIENWLLRVLGT